jgi:hypothetical protein
VTAELPHLVMKTHCNAPEDIKMSLQTSRKRGEAFASTLNGTQEAAKWHLLDSADILPELDYIALNKEFGECTREMKRAYRQGFNTTFNPVNRA